MTDTCLLAGILDAEHFAGGRFTLDPERSRAAFEGLDCDSRSPSGSATPMRWA